ncbi:hypothetical protein MTR67_045068 [Solanum verrucosum]|uniref:Uncharacterized protein n=1 Tax=Solanum verrucosum TaxID=315347 RepID=A0AAF0URL6_SOLVR|nr:hypothetical protein MTR67_045068 [Solanum verrucosum]
MLGGAFMRSFDGFIGTKSKIVGSYSWKEKGYDRGAEAVILFG